MLIVIMFAIAWGCLCAHLAENRNRSRGGWFVGGLVFGLLAVLCVFFLSPLRKSDRFLEHFGVNQP
jgi:hypothetical protein